MLTIDLSTEVLFTQLDLASECENFEAKFEWCMDTGQTAVPTPKKRHDIDRSQSLNV